MDAQIKNIIAQATPLLKNQDHLSVIKLLKQAVEDGHDHEIILGMLASSYAEIGMQDKAITMYQRLLNNAPQNHLARFQLGMLRFQEHAYAAAIEQWEIIAVEANEFVANFWIAKAYKEMSEPERAKPYLHNARMRAPADHPLANEIQKFSQEILGDA